MAYHPKPPEKASFIRAECKESCLGLKQTLGESSMLEIESYKAQLEEQRKNAIHEFANTPRDAAKVVPELAPFDSEIACINLWQSQCETELSQCDAGCQKIKETYQSGSNATLSADAVGLLMIKNLDIIDNKTLPRNEVIEAKKDLNCLDKYEVCVGRKTALEQYE